MSKIYPDRYDCDWCGPCHADISFLDDWPGTWDEDGYRCLRVCDNCLKEQGIEVPYEAIPFCEDCSTPFVERDRFIYEREGGEGWPRCCETCADQPMTLPISERMKLS